MTPRAPWLVASLLLLSSCGTSDKPKGQTESAQPPPEQTREAQAEADKIVKQQLAKVQQKEASTFPCSLFTQQEVEALAGNSLDKGSYAFNNVSENDHEYKSESCNWSASGDQGNELGVWVSLPKHFKSGKVECSPGSDTRKTSGIGDQAWWDYQKYYGIGTLRVCSDKAMLETKVTMKGKEESAAKRAAQTLAEKVLATQ